MANKIPNSKYQTIISLVNVAYNFFLDIFFPNRCAECKKPGEAVCFDCVNKIERVITSTCPECGKITKLGEYCGICRSRTKTKLKGLIIAAKYNKGPTKEMIHHFKYVGILELGDLLGELIVERLMKKMPKGNVVIVPVPLHFNREKQRGFNQAELLARYVSERLDLPGGMALERAVDTGPQIKLSGDLRRKNVVGAFKCVDRELVNKKVVLLVDDVTTTGSTLNECAKELRSAGAKQVWGVMVARG